jgi:hypothetical protein
MMTHAHVLGCNIDEVRELCRARLRDAALDEGWRTLVRSAADSLERVSDLPVPVDVVRLICAEFSFIATADDAARAKAHPATPRYERLAAIAALRRFPAGQFEWEISGLSRSDCIRTGRSLPRVAWFVARRMGGLRPVFFSHLNPRRAQVSLSEHEANRSYHRMARALEQQPEIIGFAACSWFRSPGTHRVSPHLSWLSRVFEENGGLVVEAGKTTADCGVLHRSETRRAAYAAGTFVPTRGLVMWPRAAMIAWARAHPEFGL